MTKAEVLARLGEMIPDDADVMAYHISMRNGKGVNTGGHICGKGDECLLHVGSIIHHVAESLEIDENKTAKLATMYYNLHAMLGAVDTKTETVRMEVPDDDQ